MNGGTTVKDKSCVHKIKFVFFEVYQPFCFIPFMYHYLYTICIYNAIQINRQQPVLTIPPLCYNIQYNKGETIMRVTVTQIGNSTGLILPKEAAARLKVKKGDTVYLTRPERNVQIQKRPS